MLRTSEKHPVKEMKTEAAIYFICQGYFIRESSANPAYIDSLNFELRKKKHLQISPTIFLEWSIFIVASTHKSDFVFESNNI